MNCMVDSESIVGGEGGKVLCMDHTHVFFPAGTSIFVALHIHLFRRYLLMEGEKKQVSFNDLFRDQKI